MLSLHEKRLKSFKNNFIILNRKERTNIHVLMRAGDYTFLGYSDDYAIIIILSYCILKKSVYMIN